MKHVKELYKFDRRLLGSGYDKALDYLSKIITIQTIEVKSGTEFGTWKVPNEYIVRDAWVKYNGEKIIDFKKDPLSLMDYSIPFKGTVDEVEFKKHLYVSDNESVGYKYSFYEEKWGFSIPQKLPIKEKKGFWKKIMDICEECKDYGDGKVRVKIVGLNQIPKGKYEVFIDSEFKPSTLKIGVHTIKGKSDREILLFAHLDHPYQANDNLSGVACLLDVAKKIKSEHTIKIIFCPETIGSIAYAETQDISKVDFVIAVDICGNDNDILIQKAFDKFAKINYAVHLAVHELGISYRKGDFRLLIGSDEYYFNDPMVGIPGILLSRYPYKEYHTEKDTPDIIKPERISETTDIILKTIEIMEKNYVPKRTTKGVLRRSKFGLQASSPLLNRDLDYLWYDIDGEKSLVEICLPLGLTFSYAYNFLEKLKKEGLIHENLRINISKKRE